MASRTEGIALLSMYNDEEEDDEVPEEEQQHLTPAAPEATANDYPDSSVAAAQDDASEDVDMVASPETVPASLASLSPATVDSNFNSRPTPSPTTLMPSPSPTHQPLHSRTYLSTYSATPPAQLASGFHAPQVPGPQRGKAEPRGIVDYGHDESAMSPEADEVVTTEFDTKEAEPMVSDGSGDEKYISAVISTPNQQTPPLSLEQLDISKSGFNLATNITAMELNTCDVEVEVDVTTEIEVDLLSKFLPPPPKVQCPIELQEKINKFLGFKKTGMSFNSELRSMKAYRNPDFLQHAVTYQEINQIGTCFRKHVFDAEGYDRSDYYDAIEADMKRELERKEQERKRSPKVDFIPGAIQPAIGSQGTKSSSQLPGLAMTTGSGPQLTSAITDIVTKESRQNKKSKWDKVDTDLKNPLQTGGSDTASAAAQSATILSATSAGGGYTAFAQQKRREAEEKRTSERKLERRS